MWVTSNKVINSVNDSRIISTQFSNTWYSQYMPYALQQHFVICSYSNGTMSACRQLAPLTIEVCCIYPYGQCSDATQVKCITLRESWLQTQLLMLRPTRRIARSFYRMLVRCSRGIACESHYLVQHDLRHCIWTLVCIDHRTRCAHFPVFSQTN